MDFTREPIVESVISPREGCKLVLRNSKSAGGEEYFVDAIEIVRFGSALFFRSLERPKSFMLPVSDYEVLELRETRVVLKHAVAGEKPARSEKRREPARKDQPAKKVAAKKEAKKEGEPSQEEAKPKRRRQRRRRRGEEPEGEAAPEAEAAAPPEASPEETASPLAQQEAAQASSTLLPPPTALISESIGRYKDLMTAADAEPPVEAKKIEEPVSSEPAEPALVPPGGEVPAGDETAKGLGVFSAGRFLRRLAGQEKGDEEPAE